MSYGKREVTIDGVKYPSVKSAADHFKVGRERILTWNKTGQSVKVNRLPNQIGKDPTPVVANWVFYPSMTEAAKALNTGVSNITLRIQKGYAGYFKVDKVGKVRQPIEIEITQDFIDSLKHGDMVELHCKSQLKTTRVD